MSKIPMRLTVLAVTCAATMLAACSRSDDEEPAATDSPVPSTTAPSTTTTPTPTPPPPATTPEPVPPPMPAPSETVPDTSPTGSAAPSSSMNTPQDGENAPTLAEAGRDMAVSARNMARALSSKAVDLKDSAAQKAGEVGSAIRAGAAKADATIQQSLGHHEAEASTQASVTPSAQTNP